MLDDGDWPVYIKQILPQGAAIMEGRLRSGDQLLEVLYLLIAVFITLYSSFNKLQNQSYN